MVTVAKTIQPVRMPRFGHRVDKTDPIMRGCVGWWPLNDGAGTKARDISGRGNDGTLNGGADWGSTSKGTSYQGDGVDGTSISLPGSATSQPITISCWGRFTDTYAYFFDGPNATDRLALFRFNSKLSYYAGASIVDIGTGYNDGEWHHFVIVYNGASSAAYVDGVFKVSGSAGTNQYNGLLVGSRYSNTGANSGNIQNVRVYDRALSATEVSRLYNEPWAGLEPLSPFSFFSVPTAGAPLAVFYNHYKNQGII